MRRRRRALWGEPVTIVSTRLLSIALVVFALALMLTSADAQNMGGFGGGGGGGGRKHQQQADDKSAEQKPKADDKAYAAALKSVPNKKYDPWNGMR
jgi:hypothetical protein